MPQPYRQRYVVRIVKVGGSSLPLYLVRRLGKYGGFRTTKHRAEAKQFTLTKLELVLTQLRVGHEFELVPEEVERDR